MSNNILYLKCRSKTFIKDHNEYCDWKSVIDYLGVELQKLQEKINVKQKEKAFVPLQEV